MAGGLLGLGLAPGERLMVRLPNTSDYALLFFGAIAAGIVPLPVSPQLTAAEADFLLGDSGAAALALAGGLPAPAAGGRAIRILDASAIATLKAAVPLPAYADTAAEDPGFLIYTSGTSRQPKGVLHAQRSAWGRRPMYRGWSAMGPGDIVLHAGSFNWSYTLGVGLTDPWANGATAVLFDSGPKDIQVWPKLIERARATLFAAVPSLYRQMLKYCALDPGRAGEPAPRARGRRGPARRLARGMAPAHRPGDLRGLRHERMLDLHLDPSGHALEARQPRKAAAGPADRRHSLVGGEPKPLPADEIGLLAIHRSDPGLMLGDRRRPLEEASAFRGDWFVGGDLAAFDRDGYVWHHGRADDVMNAGGYRVSPLEVEAALADCAGVAEIAVAEIPGARRCRDHRGLCRARAGQRHRRRCDHRARRVAARGLQAAQAGLLRRRPAPQRQWQADPPGAGAATKPRFVPH